MARELPKVYEPNQVEEKIYQMWLDNGCFKAEPDPNKKPFSIVAEMPLLLDTITCALKAQQLQPILWKAGN